MNDINGISAISAMQSLDKPIMLDFGNRAQLSKPSNDFMSSVVSGVEALDQNMKSAESAIRSYALGEDVSTHDLMITMEKAKFSLQLALEMRNKLVDVYKEISKFQV